MYYKNGNLKLGKIENLTLEKMEAITDEEWDQLKEEDQIAISEYYELLLAKTEKVESRLENSSQSEITKKENETPNNNSELTKGNSIGHHEPDSEDGYYPPVSIDYNAGSNIDCGIQAINDLSVADVNPIKHNRAFGLVNSIGSVIEIILFLISVLAIISYFIGGLVNINLINVSIVTVVIWLLVILMTYIIKRKVIYNAYMNGYYDNYYEDSLHYILPTLFRINYLKSERKKFVRLVHKKYGFINNLEHSYINSLVVRDAAAYYIKNGEDLGLNENFISTFKTGVSFAQWTFKIRWSLPATLWLIIGVSVFIVIVIVLAIVVIILAIVLGLLLLAGIFYGISLIIPSD
ncbi:MAG: hypothetical protein ACK5HR_03215 [Mycoplasmatales bacterium]